MQTIGFHCIGDQEYGVNYDSSIDVMCYIFCKAFLITHQSERNESSQAVLDIECK